MRILLASKDLSPRHILQRNLARRQEIHVASTIHEVLLIVQQSDWRPDVIIVDLNILDFDTNSTLEHLHYVAGTTPVIVSSTLSPEALERQLEALSLSIDPSPTEPLPIMQLQASFSDKSGEMLSTVRRQTLADLEQLAAKAAEAAVSRGLDQLMHRLGLDDVEGVKLAVRLARAWEAAKSKFLSGLATGVASAFLLAVGAGIVALLKGGNQK